MPQPSVCYNCRFGMGSVCYLPAIPRVHHLGAYYWCNDRQEIPTIGLRMALAQAHKTAAEAWANDPI